MARSGDLDVPEYSISQDIQSTAACCPKYWYATRFVTVSQTAFRMVGCRPSLRDFGKPMSVKCAVASAEASPEASMAASAEASVAASPLV